MTYNEYSEKLPVIVKGPNYLDETLDLNVIDLLVLYYLLRYPKPIIRSILLSDINSCLSLSNQLYPSRLYSSLQRLEKKQLVVYSQGHKNTTSKDVQATEKAKKIISEVNRFTIMSNADFYELTLKIFPSLLQKLGSQKFQKLLIVNLEKDLDIRILELIETISISSRLLSTDDDYRSSIERGMSNKILQCHVINNTINENDAFFDGIIVIGANINFIDNTYSERKFFEELNRVLRTDGQLLCTSIKKLKNLDHFIYRKMQENLSQSIFSTLIDEDDLKTFLERLQLKEIVISEFDGLLIGQGKKVV